MTSTPGTLLRAAARSRICRALAVLLLLAGAGGGWWLAEARDPGYPTGTYGFATGVSGGVYDTYGGMFGQYLGDHLPGVRLRLDNSEGSLENIARVLDGRDTFAFATADAVAAYDKPGKGRLRAVARLYDDYLQLVVPADSRIHSAADLKGLRVGIGGRQSGVALATRRLLTSAGLDPERDVTSEPLAVNNAAAALQAGQLDAFFWSGGLPTSALSNLSAQFPIRIVPLGDLADKVHEREGGGTDAYRAATIPADAYPRIKPAGAVPTLAVPNLLITRDDVDPDLVEQVTQAVLDSRDGIGEKVHAAQVVDLRTAVYTDPLPLHEGAKRYYTSVKP
ncbi:TAXI family TRAP transporter solute-binding subunit [Kitasatospora sp. NPDC002227]|uniref:TAXI family TRAP transporter solute-binding subunit n=1 Tax=Kitasatospora sp. NPDC002227 TaxID=3154773 RepID=UPI003325B991